MKCFVCSECNKDFWGEHPGYFIIFDKCRGKTCPDCGKVRKLGKVRILYENFNDEATGRYGKSLFGCVKCDKSSEFILNGICKDCFLEDQKNKGCICPFKNWEAGGYVYYCSLCEKAHTPGYAICRECVKKQDVSAERQRVFWKIVLPSSVVGIIIGFFLGWLFLVKLRRKKNKT